MSGTLRFGHYELMKREDGSVWELGHGAMGVTYRAFDTSLCVPVALKVIAPDRMGSETTQQRFVREARLAARLRHRHVATVYHLGHENGDWYYAMEYIDGETLADYFDRNGPLPLSQALIFADQITRALGAAYVHGLVHRDLKPANLMLVLEDGELIVKVIDFGLAKAVATAGDDVVQLTRSGFLGTPLFASPEQFNEQEIDIRSDIYSLGVTLWYLLAGRPPFSGSVGQVMSQHLHSPPPADEHLSMVPKPVATLLCRMLEKDPELRPQSPAELRSKIESVRNDIRETVIRPPTVAHKKEASTVRLPKRDRSYEREAETEPPASSKAVATPPPPESASKARLRAPSRTRNLRLAFGAGLIAVLGCAAYFAYFDRDHLRFIQLVKFRRDTPAPEQIPLVPEKALTAQPGTPVLVPTPPSSAPVPNPPKSLSVEAAPVTPPPSSLVVASIPGAPPLSTPPVPSIPDQLVDAEIARSRGDWLQALQIYLRFNDEKPGSAAMIKQINSLIAESRHRDNPLSDPDFVKLGPGLERAARGGAGEAMFLLGKRSIANDPASAFAWFQKVESASPGDDLRGEALVQSGLLISNHEAGPSDDHKASEKFLAAYDIGNKSAALALGDCYLTGKCGVERNPDQAVYYLRQAAEAGFPEAMNWLGVCYLGGKKYGISQNLSEAEKFLTEAVQGGDAEALGNLGALYMDRARQSTNKSLAHQDQVKALGFFQKGVEKKDPQSEYFYAMCLESGLANVLKPDPDAALDLYRKAAEAGVSKAQDWCHHHGIEFTPAAKKTKHS